MEKKTFAVACRGFFGFKEGQTTGDFMKEMKELTPKDRAEFSEMFKTIGIEIVESGK
jgi:hypothetical protein